MSLIVFYFHCYLKEYSALFYLSEGMRKFSCCLAIKDKPGFDVYLLLVFGRQLTWNCTKGEMAEVKIQSLSLFLLPDPRQETCQPVSGKGPNSIILCCLQTIIICLVMLNKYLYIFKWWLDKGIKLAPSKDLVSG